MISDVALQATTPQNGQTYSNNSSAIADELLEYVGNSRKIVLSVFDHFVGLTLKGFNIFKAAHRHDHSSHEHAVGRSLTSDVVAMKDQAIEVQQSWAAGLHERLPDLELHSMIGISLSLGFIFMLIIDHFSGGGHSHNNSSGKMILTK